MLVFWYSRQRMFARWGNTCSTSFCVTNGVKQGGIILPMLFNLYMYALSLKLNCSGIGRHIGTSFINHLCYADDLCLISLSSSGMQHLLNICKEYAFTHKLLYNGSKSFALCFKKNTLKVSSPSFYLDQMKIPTLDQCRYLGITISTNNSDVDLTHERPTQHICCKKYTCTLPYTYLIKFYNMFVSVFYTYNLTYIQKKN